MITWKKNKMKPQALFCLFVELYGTRMAGQLSRMHPVGLDRVGESTVG